MNTKPSLRLTHQACAATLLLLFAVNHATATEDLPEIFYFDTKTTAVRLDVERGQRGIATTVTTQTWAYDVQLTNKTFRELPPLIVQYNLFYAQDMPGTTTGPVLRQHASTFVAPSELGNNRTLEFRTDEVELSSTRLDANYRWGSGARPRSRDRLQGIWLRVVDEEGNIKYETSSPANITSEGWVEPPQLAAKE
ncbi:MAG: hypothetical protein ACFCU3_04350 [Verrucomicrobiales bacterium]